MTGILLLLVYKYSKYLLLFRAFLGIEIEKSEEKEPVKPEGILN